MRVLVITGLTIEKIEKVNLRHRLEKCLRVRTYYSRGKSI